VVDKEIDDGSCLDFLTLLGSPVVSTACTNILKTTLKFSKLCHSVVCEIMKFC